MNLFLNPCILLFLSFVISYLQPTETLRIVPMLCATIVSGCQYILLNKKYKNIIAIIYIAMCCYDASFTIFQPIVVYMSIQENKMKWSYVLFILPLPFVLVQDVYLFVLITVACSVAVALKIQYVRNQLLEQEYRIQRDATKELALLLDTQNKDLLIQQEQEIRIATLGERNRIAREIHDNVGHLLSSSLLQLGALQIVSKDESTKSGMQDLRETISTAMDSVRSSVHDLHAESLDLEIMIQKLIQRFTFCEVTFEYDMVHTFKQTIIYHILAIVKECMNNTMKHSNATRLHIVIREQPAFVQIICNDNGTNSEIKDSGIGLQNIQERIESLHGYVNISNGDGFKVFVTLPKEDTICEW